MNISLRNISIKDATTIYDWKNDKLLREMALDFAYTTSVEEQINDIKQSIASDNSDYRIILSNKKPIGYIRIDWMDRFKKNAWLRFALGEMRGKGLSKVAVKLYIDELFNNGCIRIEGEVYECNIASQKVLESVGSKKEGVKRKAHYNGIEQIDVFVYGLLKEDL